MAIGLRTSGQCMKSLGGFYGWKHMSPVNNLAVLLEIVPHMRLLGKEYSRKWILSDARLPWKQHVRINTRGI